MKKQIELTNQQLVTIINNLQKFKEQGSNMYFSGLEMLKIVRNTKSLNLAIEPYNEVCQTLSQKYNLDKESENYKKQEQLFLEELRPVILDKVTVELDMLSADMFTNHQLSYEMAEALEFMIEDI